MTYKQRLKNIKKINLKLKSKISIIHGYQVLKDIIEKKYKIDSTQIKSMHLDYVNNFLTVGAFADHYSLVLGIQITDKDANEIINMGRKMV